MNLRLLLLLAMTKKMHGSLYSDDGVLYSHDASSKVDMYLFFLVEREEEFF